MSKVSGAMMTAIVLLASLPAAAHESRVAKPDLVLREIVEGLPTAPRQEIRVMTATFQPGDRTVTHTHRFPVTVYVLEGAFTLEMEGHEPRTLRAGEAMVEPPLTKMTGYNRSPSEPTRVVIVYVSTPETPFLDLAH